MWGVPLNRTASVMGQQQLLLLVLGIVMVGLAVVVGIQAFSENRQKAELDAFSGRVVEVAAAAAAYYHTPAMFGGNERADDMGAPLSLEALGIEQTASNSNWSRLDRDGTRLQLTVSNDARPLVIMHSLPVSDGIQRVELALWGADPECFARRVRERSGSSWTTVSGSLGRPTGCSW